jgi:phosphoesterase RecJ-like protein
LKEAGYKISADVGKCLYTGLITDTGGFRFAGVNSRTLEIAAEMLGPGLDSYEITRYLYEEYPLPRLHLERLMLERAEVLLESRLLLSTLSKADFDSLGADPSIAENLVNRLREFQGILAAVLITEMEDGLIRVSFRSKGNLDVSKIAQSLGGGGHHSAAGLKSRLPLTELRSRIIQGVKDALADDQQSVQRVN